MNGPQRIVFGSWMAMVGLAVARSLGANRGLPQPSVFLGGGVLFTLYFGAAGFLGPLPAVFAVGTTVAALMLPYIRGSTGGGPLDTIAAGLDKIAGGTGTHPAASGAAASPAGASAPSAPGGGEGMLAP